MRIFGKAGTWRALAAGALAMCLLWGNAAKAGQGGVVALTFDDGPHPRLTARLLDILQQHQVPATFYVVGWRVERWPHLVRRMVREGHEVGNHSWRHRNLARLRPAALRRELQRADDAIMQATGERPADLRPPYGSLNMRVLRHEPRRFTCWSIDTRDWKSRNARAIIRRALRARNGSVLLFHDTVPATIAAMPTIIRKLKARGMRFVHASQLDAPCVRRKIYLARKLRRQRGIMLAARRKLVPAPALRGTLFDAPEKMRAPALRLSMLLELQ